ncbi:MAG: pth, partial [Verrucomicrobiales bacterium]|nr:pth [Verrucomicrobiales bacterium]
MHGASWPASARFLSLWLVMDNLFLIVGLGNPGREYAGTRHNAGFLALEKFAERLKAGWKQEDKFQARIARSEYCGQKLVLCQPQTFMNSSGIAVLKTADYFKIPLNRLLVSVDDADLPFGEIRLRQSGSSGGHHGLDSVQSHLGSKDYARQRIGIGRTASGVRDIHGHVLGRFNEEDRILLEKVLVRAAHQMVCWMEQ